MEAEHEPSPQYCSELSGLLAVFKNRSNQLSSFSTASAVISANGNGKGILWILDNLATMFYISNQAANNWGQSDTLDRLAGFPLIWRLTRALNTRIERIR
jgi:hypothetical protein